MDAPVISSGPRGMWRTERFRPMRSKPMQYGGHRLRIYGAPIYRMIVGEVYPGFNLVARGGVPPYTFSIAQAELFWETEVDRQVTWTDNTGKRVTWQGMSGDQVTWDGSALSGNQVTWRDSNGQEVVWVTDNPDFPLPPGLLINAVTGMVTGTPTEIGVFPVRFQVTDSRFSTALTDIMFLEVLPQPPS